jgi:hypothetical protein
VTRQPRSIEAFDDAWIVRDNALNHASESHPRRRALGPRLAHGALVGVTPRFVVVAVSVHRLFERAGTHVKKPTTRALSPIAGNSPDLITEIPQC